MDYINQNVIVSLKCTFTIILQIHKLVNLPLSIKEYKNINFFSSNIYYTSIITIYM